MTTIEDIKDRLVAICPLIQLPGLALGTASTTDPVEPLLDDQLPFFLVRDGRGIEYRKIQQGMYLSTREMTVTVHLSRRGDESYVEAPGAQASAEACIQPLARVFLGNETLRLNDNGIVRSSRPDKDSGVRTLPVKNGVNTDYVHYRGVVLRLRVTFIDTFNEDD